MKRAYQDDRTRPDVALTDYGLAVECALFAYLIHLTGASALSFVASCWLATAGANEGEQPC